MSDCLQGGVLSPLLWCLVVDELLTKLRESGFHVYADDYVTIIIRGNSLTTLNEHIAETLIIKICVGRGN